MGITLYPNDATDIDDLLKNVDQAMYVAKKAGRNRHSYFTQHLQKAAQSRLRLIADLHEAVSGNQLRVYFQPIIDLNSGRVLKAEALVRWMHPQRGLVSPADFIPVAEETGLISEVGDWVFQEALRWTARWRELVNDVFQVSVNRSPIEFAKETSRDSWVQILKSMGLPGASVVVEITEGVLVDSDSPAFAALVAYRDSGIQVSIDDFGTGYSSLAYLKKFDIDYLKIDQSFIKNLAVGSSDLALSKAIIVMAHELGLKVIAEGVETTEQRDLLLAAGCDYAQGYLFSKPIPPEEFEVFLMSV
jgi:EAL domain-containing protein (putative c-di-GMP-specific phosphodiesterase class I)